MIALVKSNWKHALFVVLAFGFVGCATSTPQPPAAEAKKEAAQPKAKHHQTHSKKKSAAGQSEPAAKPAEGSPR